MLKQLLGGLTGRLRARRRAGAAGIDAASCLARALALQQAGDLRAAEQAWRDAVALHPAAVELHLGLAQCLHQRARHSEACIEFEQVIALAADAPQAYLGAGLASLALRRYPEAIEYFQQTLDRDPRNGTAFAQLCVAQHRIDDHAGLRVTFLTRQRAALSPDGAAIARALSLPSMLDSAGQIAPVRAQLGADLDELQRRPLVIRDPVREIGMTSFNLAYQGQDDRTMHERIARLHLHACPSLAYVAPHCADSRRRSQAPLRVGIVSSYLYDHSIGRVVRGLFATLDRRRVSVHGFVFETADDPVYLRMQRDADSWTILPRDLAGARASLAGARLDVLLYPDIGMDPFTYFLAFSRLAPVQCTTWGHPVTSGIPALDYFISTGYFEPAAGARHYSERLERLDRVALPGYYYRPYAECEKPPAAPGFDRGRRIYFCPQMLFKFHPDFDAVLVDILRRDPGGEVVVTHDSAADEYRLGRLQARLQRCGADVFERMIFLPRTASPAGYVQRLQACSVVLDTLHYCGGNTSLEAISAGALVVTLPGALQRGRHTYGFFRKMGFTETVVDSPEAYAILAVRIAKDDGLRAHLRALQRERAAALYEEIDAVRQIEDLFVRARAAAQDG